MTHPVLMALAAATPAPSAQTIALAPDQWNFVVVGVLAVVFFLGAIVGERL